MDEDALLGIIKRETLSALGKSFVDFLMIFSPSVGYIAQGIKLRQTRSSKGFSKYMCLLLLFANILRVFFWIGKQFTVVLLFQSIIVIICQFFLIHMSLKYTNDKSLPLPVNIKAEDKEKTLSLNQILLSKLSLNLTLNKKFFWKWENVIEYYKFIIIFVFAFYVLCRVIGFNNKKFIDFIGAVSALSESVIAIPQIKENFVTKDTMNVSFLMVSTWLVGDVFKMFYYIYSMSPKQLVVCGFFQVMLDIILTTQVFFYGEKYIEKKESRDKEKKPLQKKNEENVRLMKEEDEGANTVENDDIGINITIEKKKEKKEKKDKKEKKEKNEEEGMQKDIKEN